MPSIPYQRRDERPRNEEVHDNSVEFTESSHPSPPGKPKVIHPITPVQGAMVKYDRSANGAIQTATGTPGGTILRNAQQNRVPPGNNQSTSRGGIPAHGIPLNETPGPSRRSRPDSNKGKSRTKSVQSGAPKQIIKGNNAKVKNEKSFNNYNYNIGKHQDSDSEESSESESEGSSDCD